VASLKISGNKKAARRPLGKLLIYESYIGHASFPFNPVNGEVNWGFFLTFSEFRKYFLNKL